MSILSWINQREALGFSCFTREELCHNFSNVPAEQISVSLSRLVKRGILFRPHMNFYVKIPVHYMNSGFVPPYYYIDQLMTYLNKKYYIGLLSAAQLYGAAHQAPQQFMITTSRPVINVSQNRKATPTFNYRTEVPESLLVRKNSETGYVFYSNPELTAVDLVQFEQRIGGLQRAATVLAELLDSTDFSKINDQLLNIAPSVVFQRLGYIVEELIGDKQQGEILHKHLLLNGMHFCKTALSKRKPVNETHELNSRWQIIVNTELELDVL